MNKEDFQNLLRKEWEDNVFNPYSNYFEDQHFLKLYELKNRLYDLFFPLGISDNSLHDVCKVYEDLYHTCEDDGEMSIVIAYTDLPQEMVDSYVELMRKFRPDYVRLPTKPYLDVFIMNGWFQDLTEEQVKKYATYHCPDRTFVSYIAKNVNWDVLDKLNSFVPRFNRLEEILDLPKTSNNLYYDYRKETELALEEMIKQLP